MGLLGADSAPRRSPASSPVDPRLLGRLNNGNLITPAGPRGVVDVAGPAGSFRLSNAHGMTHIEAKRLSLSTLATEFLGRLCDHPVIDATHLNRSYQLTIDLPTEGPTAKDPAGVPLGTLNATLAKLGLRLQRSTGPVEYLMVDSVEKGPKAN